MIKKTQKRRRMEAKTDYAKRIKLLKSNRPRIVIRKTNKYILGQYIRSEEARDQIETGISSKILLSYGWPKESESGLKSIPASYLTGLLFGKKIISKNKEKNVIIDMGMARSLHKTKIYGFVKGLLDSGIQIKYKKDIFPNDKRIAGEHLKNKINFEEIKSKIEGKK